MCPVWLIDGDGCFQMTNQELATATLNEIPIKIAVINNSSLGMVRQWQTLFYGQRYSNTDLHTGAGTARIPDFVKLAEAYGVVGIRCERLEDVDDVIARANAITTDPSSSTSSSRRTPRCGPWWPRACPMTRSSTPGA